MKLKLEDWMDVQERTANERPISRNEKFDSESRIAQQFARGWLYTLVKL